MQTNIRWNSRLAFTFAASSAAIGLGNIWRFPYMLGQHGGGIFVLLYLLCVLILGIPLLMVEVTLGKISRRNPVAAFFDISKRSGKSPAWRCVAGLTILTGFLILTYYVVIVGWVVSYTIRAAFGIFMRSMKPSH